MCLGSISCATTPRAPSLPIPHICTTDPTHSRAGRSRGPPGRAPPAPKQQQQQAPCFQTWPCWLQTIFRARVRPRPRQEATPVSQPPRGRSTRLLPLPSSPDLQMQLQHLEKEKGAQPELEKWCPHPIAPNISPSRRSAPLERHRQDPTPAAGFVCWKSETSG